MNTILRLKQDNFLTYMMILTDNTCSIYDFLTYDNQSSSFVDENFSKDSFITKNENPRKISKMIEKIGDMINSIGLKSLMYDNLQEYKGIKIESIHVPEEYTFKFNNIF